MRIISLIGLPKKSGETIEQLHYFEEAISVHPDVEYSRLFLKDYDIRSCKGCNTCFHKGEELCPLKDNVQKIVSEIDRADGVIFVSTIYSESITGVLKLLLDRLAYKYHRSQWYKKVAFHIVPKSNMIPRAMDYLTRVTGSWLLQNGGESREGIIKYHSPAYREKYSRNIRKKAELFLKRIQTARLPRPSLMQLITFNIWKYRAGLKEPGDRDFQYFSDEGLFKAEYYYPIRLSLFRKILLRLMMKGTLWYMKKQFGDLKDAI